MLAAFFAKAHRVWENRERIGFSESRNGVEAALLEKLICQRLRRGRKSIAKLLHHARRKRAIEHGTSAIVLRRVLLQDQAWRPPGLLLREIAHADAAARAE